MIKNEINNNIININLKKMIKKVLVIALIAVVFAACGGNADKKENAEAKAVEIALADFETKAGDFVDKEVKISGLVDHICKHGGKRLFMVDDDNVSLHIEGKEKFDDELAGSDITVTGIVRVEKIDEAYCLKIEEDNINSHENGEKDKAAFDDITEYVKSLRDSISGLKKGYIPIYSVDYVSHVENN